MINRKVCLSILFMLFAYLGTNGATDLAPGYLRTEYKENPFIDVQTPRLSWELKSDVRNQFQKAYQVLVASSPQLLEKNQGDLWDSGKIYNNATNQIQYKGKRLRSSTKVWWKVRAWDKEDKAGQWSESATWEMGLLAKADWKASWIGYDLDQFGKAKEYHLPPAPYLRKEATLKRNVKSARLYITSLGLYEFYINGNRVGDDWFSPGWTDYDRRVYYQVYDVKNLLESDVNAFAAVLSYGWYSGYLGYALLVGSPQVRNYYGKVPLLKAQVHIEYEDGGKETIVTDNTWKASQGPLQETDILQGETYDSRLELPNWDKPGFDDSTWRLVSVFPDKESRLLQIYPGDPIRVISELSPKAIAERPNGKYIVDLGQNFAGVVRINLKGNAGDSIVLRYGEMLHPDGSLMTENLRKARATDTYVLNGNKDGEQWTPKFTYHGFQYVEISGLREKPTSDILKGLVLSSATPSVGTFETDNAMLNQLYSNIVWTQRANYFDIPTDCPQRDERLAWTGDAQVYIKSATFNNDIAAFYTKWLTDLNDAQWSNGAYPIYAPMPMNEKGESAIRASDSYSPGWSEAGIICPYEIYRAYGDTRVLAESLPYMVSFMDFLEEKSEGSFIFKEASFEEIAPKGGFGDWLSIGKKTPPDLLATLYYGYCAKLLIEMCNALGEEKLALRFQGVLERVKDGFRKHYMDENGKFKTNSSAYGDGDGYVDGKLGFDAHTQTAYGNAIYMGLLSDDHQVTAGELLKQLVVLNGNKLTTGFLGFKPLLPALSKTGNADLAYMLLLSTEYPSLGFEVVNGATSIWERWDSYIKDKGFEHNASMNSFSHYSFGSVNEWMFQNMAGIQADQPGYRTFIIKPEIAQGNVSQVSASYRSINGLIKSSWKRGKREISQEVTVPVNTTARIFIPAKNPEDIEVNGRKLNDYAFVKVLDREKHHVVVEAGSGNYKFTSLLSK